MGRKKKKQGRAKIINIRPIEIMATINMWDKFGVILATKHMMNTDFNAAVSAIYNANANGKLTGNLIYGAGPVLAFDYMAPNPQKAELVRFGNVRLCKY